MADNVFILGAGASYDSGAPLMNNFIDVAEDLLFSGKFNAYADGIQSVFKFISQLQSVYAKAYLDLNNIETIFGALEMARIIEKLGSYSSKEIIDLRLNLITMIVKTLEAKMKFPVISEKGPGPRIRCTPSYQRFIDVTKMLDNNVSIITFNYDLALDFALHNNSMFYQYCLEDEPKKNVIKLLKLHGSINWGICKDCNKIIPYYLNKFFSDVHYSFLDDAEYVLIDISSHIENLKKYHKDCEYCDIDNVPVLIPPTWNKSDYHGNIRKVWHEATIELGSAKNIYVMGYSLPESDLFFKYLFALGSLSDSRIRRFWVFDPEDTGKTKERYESLIGRNITDRFFYYEMTFSDANRHLNQILKNE